MASAAAPRSGRKRKLSPDPRHQPPPSPGSLSSSPAASPAAEGGSAPKRVRRSLYPQQQQQSTLLYATRRSGRRHASTAANLASRRRILDLSGPQADADDSDYEDEGEGNEDESDDALDARAVLAAASAASAGVGSPEKRWQPRQRRYGDPFAHDFIHERDDDDGYPDDGVRDDFELSSAVRSSQRGQAVPLPRSSSSASKALSASQPLPASSPPAAAARRTSSAPSLSRRSPKDGTAAVSSSARKPASSSSTPRSSPSKPPVSASSAGSASSKKQASAAAAAKSFPGSTIATHYNPKGLRYCSLQVCDLLSTGRASTYNEVAEQLVEFSRLELLSRGQEQPITEAKNIRRRVYDAINVLLATGIVRKERKQLRWRGLDALRMPGGGGGGSVGGGGGQDDGQGSADDDGRDLESDQDDQEEQPGQEVDERNLDKLRSRILGKEELLEGLALQLLGTGIAACRNQGLRASDWRTLVAAGDGAVTSPFVLVKAPKDVQVSYEGSDSGDMLELHLDQPFRLMDEHTVFKLLGRQFIAAGGSGHAADRVPAQLQPYLRSLFPEVAERFRHQELELLLDSVPPIEDTVVSPASSSASSSSSSASASSASASSASSSSSSASSASAKPKAKAKASASASSASSSSASSSLPPPPPATPAAARPAAPSDPEASGPFTLLAAATALDSIDTWP